MKTRVRVGACLLAILMLFGCQGVWAEEDFHFESAYYQIVLDGLLKNYKFESDPASIAAAIADVALRKHPELLEEFIDVTADQFDKHTDYFTQEELKAFNQSLNAEYVGIGVSVQRVQGAVEVASIFADSPAAMAGMLAGDKFITVGGQDVRNATVDELVALVRGEAGTSVKITVERDGEQLDFTVLRAEVQQNSVSYQILEDGIGYMSISTFNSQTPYEVENADAFFRNKKIKKLVIDLRDNPGGELLSVVNTLGFFVPQGKTVVKLEYANADRNSSLRSVGDIKTSSGYKLAVLVNGGTASAAEIFSGNIRDYKLGKLIGSRTYGKGTVQEFVGLLRSESLPLGEIKLTTGEYVLPNGDHINGIGLEPDFWVANRTVLLDIGDMEDMVFGLDLEEGDSGKAVLALKQRFDALGYFVGEIDDQFDRELSLSVKQFQASAGLPATGIMDMDTETLFSNVVGSAKVLMDDQLDRAVEYLKTGK